MEDTCKNCAKCGKGFKIGTNEAYNIKIKTELGGISKIFCFCSNANMAPSDKGISLKRKFLKKFLLNQSDDGRKVSPETSPTSTNWFKTRQNCSFRTFYKIQILLLTTSLSGEKEKSKTVFSYRLIKSLCIKRQEIDRIQWNKTQIVQ